MRSFGIDAGVWANPLWQVLLAMGIVPIDVKQGLESEGCEATNRIVARQGDVESKGNNTQKETKMSGAKAIRNIAANDARASCGIRTHDLPLTKRVLCQLS